MTSEMAIKMATMPQHLARYRNTENDMSNAVMGEFVREVVGAGWTTDHVVIARHEEVFRKTPDLMMEADYYKCHPPPLPPHAALSSDDDACALMALVPGVEGYCEDGYYAGWVADEASSLTACMSLCLGEPKCDFVAFSVGRSCSRYTVGDGGVCAPRSDSTSYQLYEKVPDPTCAGLMG